MWQGTSGPLGRPVGSVELPKKPAMGPMGRGATCGASSSFRDASAMEVGEQQALFGDCPTVEGTHHPLGWETGSKKEGESTHQLHRYL